MAASERKKLLDVKSANPDLDLRLVFMRDNKITKRSKKRYSDWAEENGFPWAIGEPPDEWF